MNEDRSDQSLEYSVCCKLFEAEYRMLHFIVANDPDVFDASHAIRIAVKQFIGSRLADLEQQGKYYEAQVMT